MYTKAMIKDMVRAAAINQLELVNWLAHCPEKIVM
jgi:hypothetical protein